MTERLVEDLALVSGNDSEPVDPAEYLTDNFVYFNHKGFYHAVWQYLAEDGRWWGKSEFGPGWSERVRWHPDIRMRAKINRVFSIDLIVELREPMKRGDVLNIWGTIFETAWNVERKEDLIRQIEAARAREAAALSEGLAKVG